jgi:hypothetical protein
MNFLQASNFFFIEKPFVVISCQSEIAEIRQKKPKGTNTNRQHSIVVVVFNQINLSVSFN